ncbi:hypothetical protein QQP08_011602 [Theobroma cacao]|nr:hypothetical protein QQP08_011602 [Theobroma cacao]
MDKPSASNEPIKTPINYAINNKLLAKYASASRTVGQTVSSNLWEDDELLSVERIVIEPWDTITAQSRQELTVRAVTCLTSHVTVYLVGVLIQCAWGITSAAKLNKKCFNRDKHINPAKQVKLDNLDEAVLYRANCSNSYGHI